MRRIAAVPRVLVTGALALGVLTTGVLTTAGPLGLSGPAWAAGGTLVVGGTAYQDPSGCYTSAQRPLSVTNDTDELVTVFSEPDCTGARLAVLAPGTSLVSALGAGVHVD